MALAAAALALALAAEALALALAAEALVTQELVMEDQMDQMDQTYLY
jgi:hypothetical protein